MDFRAEFPWLAVLPPDDVAQALRDFEAAESVDALAQVVREWRATAEVHADPDLYAALTGPTGDYGPVLPPERFDEQEGRQVMARNWQDVRADAVLDEAQVAAHRQRLDGEARDHVTVLPPEQFDEPDSATALERIARRMRRFVRRDPR